MVHSDFQVSSGSFEEQHLYVHSSDSLEIDSDAALILGSGGENLAKVLIGSGHGLLHGATSMMHVVQEWIST